MSAPISPLPTPDEILQDYRLAYQSRQASLIGRREVLSGKAKFGIFGDGKELPQLAMARAFRKGDFRSGYYRDQTFMFAIGRADHPAVLRPALCPRRPVKPTPPPPVALMNGHFATRSLNPDGSWKDLTDQYNSAADLSPTGSQMPRLVGLAYASKLYRQLDELRQIHPVLPRRQRGGLRHHRQRLLPPRGCSGSRSTPSACCAARRCITIYDDGYGISVPNEIPDGQGEHLRAADGLPAPARRMLRRL